MITNRCRHFTYKHTIYACMTACVVQAIVNNFVPLLFLTLQKQYGISLIKITFLITFNFVLQLFIDFISAFFVDRIGYLTSILIAHAAAAAGLIMMTVLPDIMPDAYIGLLISVFVYAVGGGLMEVLVSPIVEACPTENKEAAMSMLHSFYCWGTVGVVLLSTMFFFFAGIKNWKIIALIWSVMPIINLFIFTKVPIASPNEERNGIKFKELAKNGLFWIFVTMMICAGASEQAVSQWASAFAERGLNVSKTAGDLAGPMFFSILMGTSRTLYGKLGEKLVLIRFMRLSVILCIIGYCMIVFSPYALLSLIGCGICGFAVGILWPGTLSLSSKKFARGGTLLFSLLALGGDIGCSLGPTAVGAVASAAGGELKAGFGAAMLFPLFMGIGIFIISQKNKIQSRS